MKRIALFAVLLLLVAGGGMFVYAAESHSSTRLTVSPSAMKDGETKSFTDDGRKITVRRQGDTTHVVIEGAAETRTLSIGTDGSSVRIDGGRPRAMILGSGRPRVMIEGFDAPDLKMLPRRELHGSQTWFVCPTDHTMLRVPEGKTDQRFKCPVDGTTMEKRKGRGFGFFFDHEFFDSHDL